jgi:hypothetical protein
MTVLQLGGHGPLEKQIKCLERARTNSPEAMASSPIEKVQNCGEATVPSAADWKSNSLLHDARSQYCRPLAATGASREGSFVVRTNRHGCARFLLARLGIGEASCR